MALTTKPCKHGKLTFFDNDYWIGGALRETGEYSEGEVQKLLALVGVNAVVVEVGANIGAITVPLANTLATVYAFEPQRAIYDVLCGNVTQVNGTVVPENKAVGAKPGFCSMEPIDLAKPDINTGGVAIADDKAGDTEVTTLDLYCRNFSRLDLIKIDVEGREGDVIAGATHTINRFRPVLYVENDRAEKSKALIEQIFRLGYVLYWHLPPLYNPDPVGQQNVVSVNMVCLPANLSFAGEVLDDLWPINSTDDDWRLAYDKQFKLGAFAAPSAPPAVKGREWACIVRQGGIGDNLIASAVLPYLKEKYGHVEVISQEPQYVVFENNPYIDKLSVKKPGTPPWGDGKSWQAYWLDRASECAFFAQLGHSMEGLRAYHDTMSAFYWPAAARRKFAGQNYLETVGDICGVPYDRLQPNFFPTEAEITDAARTKAIVGGRFIGWVLTGSRADKIWPFAAITIARVVREIGVPVVMFGAPGKDFEIAKEIERQFVATTGSRQGLHLALSTSLDKPNWPVRRSLAQLQAADVVVTPDTGPAWAVAMRPMPKIVLISHASAENITKRWINTVTLHADQRRVPCWPCHLLHDTPESCERVSGRTGEPGAACISDIGAGVVFDEIAKAVAEGRATWTSSSP